jgi:hypothetical protein
MRIFSLIVAVLGQTGACFCIYSLSHNIQITLAFGLLELGTMMAITGTVKQADNK